MRKTVKKRIVGLTAIDLFAGGGGWTEGLKQAGFRVVFAVEKEEHAAATYRSNHPEVCLLRRDAVKVSGADLDGKIDLLAGCPPCQGFTKLNRRLGDDPRNELIFQMFRIAKEARPKAIMMENVSGLATKGKDNYERLKRKLESLGYKLKEGLLDAADYGVPQRRLRLILLGGLGFEIQLPQATHGENGIPWRTVRHAIGSMESPLTFAEARKEGKILPSEWHLVRTLSEKTLSGGVTPRMPSERISRLFERIRAYGVGQAFADDYRRMYYFQQGAVRASGGESNDLCSRGSVASNFPEEIQI